MAISQVLLNPIVMLDIVAKTDPRTVAQALTPQAKGSRVTEVCPDFATKVGKGMPIRMPSGAMARTGMMHRQVWATPSSAGTPQFKKTNSKACTRRTPKTIQEAVR